MKNQRWRCSAQNRSQQYCHGTYLLRLCLLHILALFPRLNNMHVQEPLQHAHILGPLWSVSLFGSVLFGVVSLFGLGWSRWTGILANGSAFVCTFDELRGGLWTVQLFLADSRRRSCGRVGNAFGGGHAVFS